MVGTRTWRNGLVMWVTAFLLDLTDPLGVAESFAQDRAVHGYEHKIDHKLLKPMVHYSAKRSAIASLEASGGYSHDHG